MSRCEPTPQSQHEQAVPATPPEGGASQEELQAAFARAEAAERDWQAADAKIDELYAEMSAKVSARDFMIQDRDKQLAALTTELASLRDAGDALLELYDLLVADFDKVKAERDELLTFPLYAVPLPTPTTEPERCPNCGSKRIAPTAGNAVGNTMDCLLCGSDFTPAAPTTEGTDHG